MVNTSTKDIGKMNRNAQLTPFTTLLKKRMPRKSDALVAAQLNGTKAVRTHNTPVPDPASSNNMQKAADSVQKLLQVESGRDEVTVATIFFVALSHPSIKGVRIKCRRNLRGRPIAKY
jgi:hypothetical protein